MSFTQSTEEGAGIKLAKVEENRRKKSILGGGNSLRKDPEAGKKYLFYDRRPLSG